MNTTTGAITVSAGTPAGTYTITYSICEKLNPSNCATATATITVGSGNLLAQNDAGTINGFTGGTVLNVLSNDSLNGQSVDTSLVNISVVTGSGNAGVVLNTTTGAITVSAGTPAGTYTITYSICEKLNPSNCATNTVQIEVFAIGPVANVDSVEAFENIPLLIQALLNDFDLDGNLDTSSLQIISQPSIGNATVNVDGTITYQSNLGFFGIDSMTYSICDSGMIPVLCDTAKIYITVIKGLRVDVEKQDVLCYGDSTGSIILKIRGGTQPYSISWLNFPQSNDSILTSLGQGMYEYEVQDSNGLLYNGSVEILQSDSLVISGAITNPTCNDFEGGTIDAEVIGGVNPYKFNWSNGEMTSTINSLKEGSYILTVSDINGCITTKEFALVIDNSACLDIFIPQGFSPNNDGINDFFVIEGIDRHSNNSIKIFNRWGSVVYESKPYLNNWDGKPNVGFGINNNGFLPSGTYFYLLELEPDTKPVTGFIYLSR